MMGLKEWFRRQVKLTLLGWDLFFLNIRLVLLARWTRKQARYFEKLLMILRDEERIRSALGTLRRAQKTFRRSRKLAFGFVWNHWIRPTIQELDQIAFRLEGVLLEMGASPPFYNPEESDQAGNR